MITTVIDKLALNGKNIALFATSGGSSYERALAALNENNYDVTVNQGAVLNNRRQIDAWLRGLNFR